MNSEGVERRLAAILSADAVGYSRLMAEDETATIHTLGAYREQIGVLVRQHRGRVVDAPGDNLLAEFPTALDAVRAAVEIQRVLRARNADLAPDRRMEFRIGVHLGDVAVEGDRIYGDGVNIAARLEGLAQAGGICISDMIYRQVGKKLDLEYEDLGEQSIKNIPDPVRVYRIGLKSEEVAVTEALPGMKELTVPGFSDRAAIAVLPLENLSGDPEQEYFADGIAEDLITRLSSFCWFPVIARNSSFTYKGKAVDVKQVSRELGVRYVVEGSVRKAGDRVRISAQLIDASTGQHVWAERYDRELQDIFALQDEITEAIVAAMYPELWHSEVRRAGRQEPQNLAAWECALRGWWHWNSLSKDENARARDLFARAAELDPGLATAFSGTSATHCNDLIFQWTESPEWSLGEAVRTARESVKLDNRDPYGQLALGLALSLMGQQEEMLAALEHAVLLNPSMPIAHSLLGAYKAIAGRVEEGIASIEKGMRLSPRDPQMWLSLDAMAYAQFAAGRYDEAAEWEERCLRHRPDYSQGYFLAAASYANLGRLDKARRALEGGLRLQPGYSLSVAELVLSTMDPAIFERFIAGLRKAGLKE